MCSYIISWINWKVVSNNYNSFKCYKRVIIIDYWNKLSILYCFTPFICIAIQHVSQMLYSDCKITKSDFIFDSGDFPLPHYHITSIQPYNEHHVQFTAALLASKLAQLQPRRAPTPTIVCRMLNTSRLWLVSCCSTPSPQLAFLAVDQAATFSVQWEHVDPLPSCVASPPSPSSFLPFCLSRFAAWVHFIAFQSAVIIPAFHRCSPPLWTNCWTKTPGVSLDCQLFPENRQWEKNNKVVTALPLRRLCLQNL